MIHKLLLLFMGWQSSLRSYRFYRWERTLLNHDRKIGAAHSPSLSQFNIASYCHLLVMYEHYLDNAYYNFSCWLKVLFDLEYSSLLCHKRRHQRNKITYRSSYQTDIHASNASQTKPLHTTWYTAFDWLSWEWLCSCRGQRCCHKIPEQVGWKILESRLRSW